MPRPNGSAFRSTSSASPRNGVRTPMPPPCGRPWSTSAHRVSPTSSSGTSTCTTYAATAKRSSHPTDSRSSNRCGTKRRNRSLRASSPRGCAPWWSRRWPTGSVPKPSAASSTRHSWPRCPQAPTPTAKTANIPHLLLRRPHLPLARTFPARTAAASQPRHPPRRRHRAHLHLLVRRTRSGRITLRSAAVASSRRGDGMFPCTLPGFTVPPGCPVPAAPP